MDDSTERAVGETGAVDVRAAAQEIVGYVRARDGRYMHPSIFEAWAKSDYPKPGEVDEWRAVTWLVRDVTSTASGLPHGAPETDDHIPKPAVRWLHDLLLVGGGVVHAAEYWTREQVAAIRQQAREEALKEVAQLCDAMEPKGYYPEDCAAAIRALIQKGGGNA